MRVQRALSGPGISGGTLGLLLALAAGIPAQELEIHHIDVDQGDATLFVMPNGATLLVDAGLPSRGDEVAAYLESQDISNLDAFVLTHYDRDHYGGVEPIVSLGITADAWYDRGQKEHLPPGKREDLEDYEGAAGDLLTLHPGMTLDLDPTVSVAVVASNGHVRGAVGRYSHPAEENAYSVALLVSHNGFNYLVAGDLTTDVEDRLVREAALGDLDVLKVSHHGAATSSSPPFLALVRPEVAVISNGSHGCFNHPRQAVLDNLGQVAGITIFQTNRLQDEDLEQCRSHELVGGNVADELIADPETDDSDGTVLIVVGEDGYEVRMPASDFARTFPIQRE